MFTVVAIALLIGILALMVGMRVRMQAERQAGTTMVGAPPQIPLVAPLFGPETNPVGLPPPRNDK
jgi:hypothetical protein